MKDKRIHKNRWEEGEEEMSEEGGGVKARARFQRKGTCQKNGQVLKEGEMSEEGGISNEQLTVPSCPVLLCFIGESYSGSSKRLEKVRETLIWPTAKLILQLPASPHIISSGMHA